VTDREVADIERQIVHTSLYPKAKWSRGSAQTAESMTEERGVSGAPIAATISNSGRWPTAASTVLPQMMRWMYAADESDGTRSAFHLMKKRGLPRHHGDGTWEIPLSPPRGHSFERTRDGAYVCSGASRTEKFPEYDVPIALQRGEKCISYTEAVWARAPHANCARKLFRAHS
jgi:hypothetical protein